MPRIPSIRLLCLWVNFIVLTVGGDSTSTHKKLRQTQFHNQQITALHQPSTLDFSPQSTHPATAVSQPSQEDQINLPRNKSERRAPYQNDIPTSTLFNGRRKLSWWNSVWNYVKCPPGPLGRHCHESSSTDTNTNTDTDTDTDTGTTSTSTSTSSVSSTDDGSSSGSEEGDASESAAATSGNYDATESNGTSTSSSPIKALLERWPLGALIMGLVLISMGVLGIVYRKDIRSSHESSQVSDAHLLEGAVKKRQNRFQSALQMSSISTQNTLIKPIP